jgi:acetyltransferase-like isoleucine patch superfamily enzyme
MSARIHPTAIVEEGVEIGKNTAIWDNAHLRGPARIGRDCIVGEKTYIAYGVTVADRVKINAFVYICTGVTVETGVMISAGTIFTNDRYPRATTPDLDALRPSGPDEDTCTTLVKAGATIGAGAVIGCDVVIGRFAVVGMGAVVTRNVPDFQLVIGQPARPAAFVCRCGAPFHRFAGPVPDTLPITDCRRCGRSYRVNKGEVIEIRSCVSEHQAGEEHLVS